MKSVLEVHRNEGRVWEASVPEVRSRDEVLVQNDLDGRDTAVSLVRVGQDVRRLTVYLAGEDTGYITWEDAFHWP